MFFWILWEWLGLSIFSRTPVRASPPGFASGATLKRDPSGRGGERRTRRCQVLPHSCWSIQYHPRGVGIGRSVTPSPGARGGIEQTPCGASGIGCRDVRHEHGMGTADQSRNAICDSAMNTQDMHATILRTMGSGTRVARRASSRHASMYATRYEVHHARSSRARRCAARANVDVMGRMTWVMRASCPSRAGVSSGNVGHGATTDGVRAACVRACVRAGCRHRAPRQRLAAARRIPRLAPQRIFQNSFHSPVDTSRGTAHSVSMVDTPSAIRQTANQRSIQ